jgi:hypothetical protein
MTNKEAIILARNTILAACVIYDVQGHGGVRSATSPEWCISW